MGKKLTATVDEVEEAKAQVETKIDATKVDIESKFEDKLKQLEERLRQEVQKVQGNVEKLDDIKIEEGSCTAVADEARRNLEQTADALKQDIKVVYPVITETAEDLRGRYEKLVDEKDAATREAFSQELVMLCTRFDQELASVREILENDLQREIVEVGKAIREERVQVDAIFVDVRKEAAEATEVVRKEACAALAVTVEEQEKADKKQDQKLKNAVADVDYHFTAVEKEIVAQAEIAAKAVVEAVAKAEVELKALQEETVTRFEGLDDDIHKIHVLFSDIENVPTRKLEWVIENADTNLKRPKLPSINPDDFYEEKVKYASWFSPKFDAAGAKGMQFEFRLFRVDDPPGLGEGKGDCGVLLHAPQGTHIAFKLSIGKASETFEHRFRNKGSVGQQRLASFKEAIDPLKGSIAIGVEILECIYEFDRKPLVEEVPEGEAVLEEPMPTTFHLQRHINNRVLDQVKLQMDFFRKRMTRRIEWKLEEASQMKRFYAKGAPMRSHTFDAAGLEGMQLVFYPTGYDSANEGFCSAFLVAPVGATIRCWLQVGGQRRELNHTFDKVGQCGRANFCRLDEASDPEEDAIQVTLQIEEAHLDLCARNHHPPPQQNGVRSFANDQPASVPFGSTLKLQRSADGIPPGLQEVKVLPSIWASRNLHEAAVKVDGLRPLKEAGKKPRGGAARRSPSSPMLH